MVGFKVQLEVVCQFVLPKEIQAGCGVGIVLVLGRFHRLGFDVELTLETDLFLVIDSHVQEGAEVIQFTLDVGIPKGRVAFSATPKDIAFPSKLVGNLNGFLDLCGGVGKCVGIAAGSGTMHVARVGK